MSGEGRANHERLVDCPGPHVFALIPEKGSGGRDQYRCSRCTGVAPTSAVCWYLVGIKHGKALARGERSGAHPGDAGAPSVFAAEALR